jgi:hypothetical protein
MANTGQHATPMFFVFLLVTDHQRLSRRCCRTARNSGVGAALINRRLEFRERAPEPEPVEEMAERNGAGGSSDEISGGGGPANVTDARLHPSPKGDIARAPPEIVVMRRAGPEGCQSRFVQLLFVCDRLVLALHWVVGLR